MAIYKLPVLVLISFVIGIGIGLNLQNFRKASAPTPRVATSPSLATNPPDSGLANTNCGEDDYKFVDFTKEYFEKRPQIVDFVKDNCLVPINSLLQDVNGDQSEDLILALSGIGCASCHPQDLYVFIDEKPVLVTHGEDFLLTKGVDDTSFIAIKPL